MPNEASEHDWHTLDADRGLEVRQVTPSGEPNQWEIRGPGGLSAILDDKAFNHLRSDPNTDLTD